MSFVPSALRILGTGRDLPRRVVPSTDFDARWQRAPGTTFQDVGVRQRHVAAPDESSSAMAARAARQALDAAGLAPDALDCIVSACSVMEQAIPCLGAQVQRALGLGTSGIPAFDVNATCLSFLAALDLVSAAIAQGRYRHVLIVSSEIASAGLDPEDTSTAALFGDGAAAVVLGAAPADSASALLASRIETYAVGADLCQVRGGGTRLRSGTDPAAWRESSRFRMDGPATYKLAARYIRPFLARLLQQAGVAVQALDCIVPHQASGKALDHLTAALRLPPGRVVRTLPDFGNQVAASLPNALHEAVVSGALRRGQLVALLGSGAGLSLGGAVLRY